jgi:hypothetical protein
VNIGFSPDAKNRDGLSPNKRREVEEMNPAEKSEVKILAFDLFKVYSANFEKAL